MPFRDPARRPRVLALLSHIGAAIVWMFVMPGGFHFLHLRFLANRAIPAAIIAIAIAGLLAARAKNTPLLRAIILALAATWGSASLTGVILFPISGRMLFVVGVTVTFCLMALCYDPDSDQKLHTPTTLGLCVLGAIVGIFIPFTQRADPPSTHPLGGAMNQAPPGSPPGSIAKLSRGLRVDPGGDGAITFMHDRVTIAVRPTLTFISRSPDRFWTLFARRKRHDPAPRTLTHWNHTDSSLALRYTDLGITDLTVAAEGNTTARIEAASQLPHAVYSHLNTFCEISVSGHSKLALKFSPCAGEPIDVLPMDYPVGRPAQFAYLDASGVFHVVQARSAEKGPFRDLAAGKMERSQPLEITLLDNGHPIASIVLADWAAQLSTALSPTAGWGVPQNSIEFSLDAEHPRSSASFFITLASTSVGRGFDSVGHAPGIYRNRMTVQFLAP